MEHQKTPAQKARDIIRYLDLFYGKYAKAWEGQYQDDRGLYCNIYRLLVSAYQALGDANIDHPLIWCGLHDRSRQAEDTLRGIIKRFDEKMSIGNKEGMSK